VKQPRLYYFNHGRRAYGEAPVRSHARPEWEFQAVIAGQIAASGEGLAEEPRSRTLWVFEKGLAHGWTAPPGTTAEIIVFHLPPPDPVLRRVVRIRGGHLAVSIGQREIAWLGGQRESLRRDWVRPTETTTLKVAHLMSGLSLMVLERAGHEPAPESRSLDRERVDKATYWYRQNLGGNPAVEEVAAAVGVSAVHLRRIFRRELGQGPKQVFQGIRLEEAREALADPRRTVETVAADVRFSDASSFTRAYRDYFGHPPRRGDAGQAKR